MSRTGALWQRLRGSGAFGRVSRLASAAALAQGIHLAAAPFLTRWFDVAQIGLLQAALKITSGPCRGTVDLDDFEINRIRVEFV